ncbi:hypothetical protein PENSPDRAFT_650017 [Peniophora sp. CONT]|nr:hypothetical protein PENSPDRAFT_650017 [Peniophora sp. CONT]
MEFFSSVGGADPLRPSLFELIAQEQLRDLLQPALKYVLSVFAQRHPRYLIRLVNRHEEFYALLMLLVERYYLVKHNSSFAENFYGLKRRRKPVYETERARAATGDMPLPEEKLRPQEVSRSLLFLIGVPYLRAKAQDYYESLGGGIDPDLLDEGGSYQAVRALADEGLKGRLRRVYKAAYPYCNLAFEGWLLAYNIAYLFDKTPFYRPWLAWVGVDLRRLSIGDYRAEALAAQAAASVPPKSFSLTRLIRSAPSTVLSSLRVLLPTAIFFIKFLEWWYSPGSPARALSAPDSAPRVPPPRMLPPHPRGLRVDPHAYGICPICKEPWRNATALPSGYVFCYRCAFEWVEREGKCPVTLLPARTWQLRKVLV